MGKRIGTNTVFKTLLVHFILILPLIALKLLTLLYPSTYSLMSFTTLGIVFLGGTQWTNASMSLEHIRMLTFFKEIGYKNINKFYTYRKPIALLSLFIFLLFPIEFNSYTFSSFLFFLAIILFITVLDTLAVRKVGSNRAKNFNIALRITYFVIYQLVTNDIWIFTFDLEEITYNLNSFYLIILVSILIILNFYFLPIPTKNESYDA